MPESHTARFAGCFNGEFRFTPQPWWLPHVENVKLQGIEQAFIFTEPGFGLALHAGDELAFYPEQALLCIEDTRGDCSSIEGFAPVRVEAREAA